MGESGGIPVAGRGRTTRRASRHARCVQHVPASAAPLCASVTRPPCSTPRGPGMLVGCEAGRVARGSGAVVYWFQYTKPADRGRFTMEWS